MWILAAIGAFVLLIGALAVAVYVQVGRAAVRDMHRPIMSHKPPG